MTPVYDADGNLTDDGGWLYTCEAQNHLMRMETTSVATIAGHPYAKLTFRYDWQGRRLERVVWKGDTAASPTFSSRRRWLYDGWNPIAEFDSNEGGTTNIRLKTFTWGLDLSGTLQNSGGVGGLIVQTDVSGSEKRRASYDGNGNMVAWTRSNQSGPDYRCEYDAFGNTLVSEGTSPSEYGFSTKQQDAETGLYYYGYRYYDAVHGRWLSRDPIEKEGGVNLYRMVNNSSINIFDIIGLAPWENGPRSMQTWNFNPAPANWNRAANDYSSKVKTFTNSELMSLLFSDKGALLSHYLNESGKNIEIYLGEKIEKHERLKDDLVKDLMGVVRFANGIVKNKGKLISSANWTNCQLIGLDFYMMGEIRWTGQGFIEDNNGQKSMTVEYHIWDPYDFEQAGVAAAGIGMTDSGWHRLGRVGLAKEFLIKGESSRITLKWCGTPSRLSISADDLKFTIGSSVLTANSAGEFKK